MCAEAACAAIAQAKRWRGAVQDRESLQAGARRFAQTVARALHLALLCEHAAAMMKHPGLTRSAGVEKETAVAACVDACRRLRRDGVDQLGCWSSATG